MSFTRQMKYHIYTVERPGQITVGVEIANNTPRAFHYGATASHADNVKSTLPQSPA
jgi:hypothetical protein